MFFWFLNSSFAWQEYEQAYCELSLPTIVSEYTRLELLQWHPIDSPRLSSLTSLQKAKAFDVALYRPLLIKVVVPFLSDTLPLLFDPFSTKQAMAVAALYKVSGPNMSKNSSIFIILLTFDSVRSCLRI